MKISKDLPQFVKPTMLVVAGLFEADYYLANNGEIEKISTFAIEKSHYSDRENFGRRGSMVFESGDKKGIMKKFFNQEFLKQFKDHFKTACLGNKIQKVYLFAPDSVISQLKKAISVQCKEPITLIQGNFCKEHPFKLIEKTI